jgi:hypothetical protein
MLYFKKQRGFKMTIKELERFEELEEFAKDKFIECSDFYVEDWLDDTEERKEYLKLKAKFLKYTLK